MRLMALSGVEYVPEYGPRGTGGWFQISNNDPLPVAGFDWALPASPGDTTTRVAGPDSVAVIGHVGSSIVRVRVGADTLAFDLRPLARSGAGPVAAPGRGASAPLRVEAVAGARRGVLSLNQLNGTRSGDSVLVSYWSGWVLVGRR